MLVARKTGGSETPPLREDGTGVGWGWLPGRGRLETGPYARGDADGEELAGTSGC